MRKKLALLTALVLASACALASEYRDKLDNLRNIYAEHLERIESESGKKMASWPDSYTDGLRQLQSARQQKGDLDGWQAVTTELKRFAEEGDITEDCIVAKPEALRELQTRFRNVVQKYSLEKSEEILSLADMYVSRLETAQKKLTIEGLMEDAIAYNTEIRRVKASPAFTAAEFEVAAYEAAKARREQTPESDEGDDTPPPSPPKIASSPLTREGRLIGSCRAYSGSGPAVAGRRYKRLVLKPTPAARTLRKVSVQASTAQSESTGRAGEYGSKTDQTHTLLRLQLRTLSGLDVTSPVVVIQLFSRSIARKGNVEPSQLAGHRLDLPSLDSSTVTIDCPEVKTAKWDDRYSYYSSSSEKKGNEFYGVLISVFDHEGTLLYQAASGNALDDLAPTTPPKRKPAATADPRAALGRLEQAYYSAMREHRHRGGSERRKAMEEARDAFLEAKRAADRAEGPEED
jgi:hypothetical protein